MPTFKKETRKDVKRFAKKTFHAVAFSTEKGSLNATQKCSLRLVGLFDVYFPEARARVHLPTHLHTRNLHGYFDVWPPFTSSRFLPFSSFRLSALRLESSTKKNFGSKVGIDRKIRFSATSEANDARARKTDRRRKKKREREFGGKPEEWRGGSRPLWEAGPQRRTSTWAGAPVTPSPPCSSLPEGLQLVISWCLQVQVVIYSSETIIG